MRARAAALAALLLLQSATVVAADGPAPAEAFMSSLARLCGQAFAGRTTANEPRTDSDPFEGKALVMHVRECRPDVYELARPGRQFRVEFDLTRPVTPPPPPWGSLASQSDPPDQRR